MGDIGVITHDRYGVCRFCGQVYQNLGAAAFWQEALDEAATRRCNCNEAKFYQNKLRSENEHISRRKTAQEMAEETIGEMFGEQAPGYGKLEIKEGTRDFILQTAMMVYDRKMKAATINVTSGIRVKISKSSKDVLTIERSDSASWKQEVGD